ncbi:MAG: MarR family transcriptional regulator [Nocardioides sp.]|uniref:MarR family winged helix-turn-helix transcriptional regulator n=1 Tax=Nocardioides sp. TaxID=35761 RepID=UPI0039E3C8BD
MPQRVDEERAVDALVQASFAVTRVLSEVASEHDVSLTLLRLMGILLDHEPRMAELAEHLGLERSTMSGLIDRAERRGLVERRPDPVDARATVVVMTEDSRELVESARERILETLGEFLLDLHPAQIAHLTDSLETIVSTAGGTR